MASRSGCRACVVAGVLVGLGGLGACILADPPAALPTLPIQPPEILRDSVQPPPGLLVLEFPTQFVIPVAVDPREDKDVSWQLFVDQLLIIGQPAPYGEDGGVTVIIDENYLSKILPDECHTLVVLVTYSNAGGSDTVTWSYTPTQGFAGCPVFVFDAAVADASDASDDATTGSH
jgi:hypothetical protein